MSSLPTLQAVELCLVPVRGMRGRLGEMLSWLDAHEATCAGRLVHEADREVYVAAHGRLRELLAQDCDCAPRDIRFVRGLHGKPALCASHARPLLRFNISHTRGCAAIALTRVGLETGVDIENVERFDDMYGALSLFLSSAEIERVACMAPLQARALLARTWSAKEAYTKAEGLGLSHHFETLEVCFKSDDRFSMLSTSGTAPLQHAMHGGAAGFVDVDGAAYSMAAVALFPGSVEVGKSD